LYPILYQAGDFILASWHVFFVLGAFAGWYAMQAIRVQVAPVLSASALDKLFVILYASGYFGARIFSILFEDPLTGIGDFFKGLVSFGSMTLYGGILAVTLVLIIYARRHDLTLRNLAALFGGPGLIAIGLGRIGCFLNGDDYGAPIPDQYAPSWWTVQFPNLDDTLYRYPVQLWESAFGILFGLMLIVCIRRFQGRALWAGDAAVLGYAGGRYVLEMYRGDERGQFFETPLSTSQGISLVVVVLWCAYRVLRTIQASRSRNLFIKKAGP